MHRHETHEGAFHVCLLVTYRSCQLPAESCRLFTTFPPRRALSTRINTIKMRFSPLHFTFMLVIPLFLVVLFRPWLPLLFPGTAERIPVSRSKQRLINALVMLQPTRHLRFPPIRNSFIELFQKHLTSGFYTSEDLVRTLLARITCLRSSQKCDRTSC
jgi:hypothetical protein